MKFSCSSGNAINLALFLLFSFAADLVAQNHPGVPVLIQDYGEFLSTNPPPPGYATRLDYIKSLITAKDIDSAYHSGSISKPEAMLAQAIDRIGANDRNPLDIYGKVIDQFGQPVAKAKVRGFLSFDGPGIDEEHDTQTDRQGQFQFLGLHGKDLGIVPEKAGYEYNVAAGIQHPEIHSPDSVNPLVFVMYKRHATEPLRHGKIHSEVPCDGGEMRFDLLSNIQINNGDLAVMLTRKPLTLDQTNRYKPFDWTVTFMITNGGLLEITNTAYPYDAPAEGYNPAITLNFPADMAGWQYEVKRSFYFKSRDSHVYGRITVDVDASRPQSQTYFNAEIYANPGGSGNLEFDPAKQIMR